MSATITPSASEARLILIGTALLLTLGMGIRQSFGLFLGPVTHDLAVTAGDFTLALAVQNIVWGLSQALVGAISDRFGLRITMVAGAAIYVVGLGIMAAAQGALALIVSGGLMGVALSCTATSLAMTACVRAVSPARRSQMLGVVSAAGSLGTLVVPLGTQAVLAREPWQIGVLLFVLMAIAMLPAAYWAGGADKFPGHASATTSLREVLGQAMRNRPFLVMSGAYFVCGLNLVFLTTHLPAYLAICGQDPMLSAEALAVIGGVSSIGSLLTGWLGARYPKHILLGLLYILRSLMFAVYFMLPPTPTSTLLFAAAMGMLWWPGLAPLIGGLVAEIFGTRYMATLLGLSFVVHQAGSSLGAWGGGLIFDLSGSYDPAWQIGTLIGFGAGIVQILAGGPTRRQDRMIVPAVATA
ncbi:MAG TPA: MFS transporter [Xanthobacteraceae bacterium]|jgi:predicted MFS family arabinose efflux permease|nr:MFS transporter [Xanthobacteraceae bacterium]